MRWFSAFYWPEGGRFGYGYNFSCPVCGEVMNVTCGDQFVTHPEVIKRKTGGWFSRSVTVPCEYSGKKLEFVFPTTQVKVIE